MEKHKHLIWAIVAILIIGAGAHYVHCKMKGAPAPTTTPPAATGSGATAAVAATVTDGTTHNAAGSGTHAKSMQYTCHCKDESTRNVSNITDCGSACGGNIASHRNNNIRASKAWA